MLFTVREYLYDLDNKLVQMSQFPAAWTSKTTFREWVGSREPPKDGLVCSYEIFILEKDPTHDSGGRRRTVFANSKHTYWQGKWYSGRELNTLIQHGKYPDVNFFEKATFV